MSEYIQFHVSCYVHHYSLLNKDRSYHGPHRSPPCRPFHRVTAVNNPSPPRPGDVQTHAQVSVLEAELLASISSDAALDAAGAELGV